MLLQFSFYHNVVYFHQHRLTAVSPPPPPPVGTHTDIFHILKCFTFCRYLKGTLDQYVESDYTLIYFHHGLTSENKPSLSWLRDAYREFDRK